MVLSMIATFILTMYGIIFEMSFHFNILLFSNCLDLESSYKMTVSKTQINKIPGCALVTSQISVHWYNCSRKPRAYVLFYVDQCSRTAEQVWIEGAEW